MITALIKRPKGRVDIYFDEEFFGTLSEGAIIMARLSVGQVIDKNNLKQIYKDGQQSDALSDLLNALGRSSITEKQGIAKLTAKNYSDNAIKFAINRAKELGYINDCEYATNYVESNIKRYGKLKIKQELWQKGIEAELIDTILENVSEEESLKENFIALIRNKNIDPNNYKEKAKIVRSLLYKGYEYETIKDVMAKYSVELE